MYRNKQSKNFILKQFPILDKKLFESILAKDKTFEATTKQEFNIKIGNIDGIEVYFNDKPVDISKGASGSKVNTITLKRD